MANQMIALQARNPQLPDPARATTQMANMMNMASQQRAAQLQGQRIRQEMDYAQAGETRAAATHTSAQKKAELEYVGLVADQFSRDVGKLKGGDIAGAEALRANIVKEIPAWGEYIRPASEWTTEYRTQLMLKGKEIADKTIPDVTASKEYAAAGGRDAAGNIVPEGTVIDTRVGGFSGAAGSTPLRAGGAPTSAPRATPQPSAMERGPSATSGAEMTFGLDETRPLNAYQQEDLRRIQSETGMTNTPASFTGGGMGGAGAGQMTPDVMSRIVDSAFETGVMAQVDFDQLLASQAPQNKQALMNAFQQANITLQADAPSLAGSGMGQQQMAANPVQRPQAGFADFRGQRPPSRTANLGGDMSMMRNTEAQYIPVQRRDPNVAPIPSPVPAAVLGAQEGAKTRASKNVELEMAPQIAAATKKAERAVERKPEALVAKNETKAAIQSLDKYIEEIDALLRSADRRFIVGRFEGRIPYGLQDERQSELQAMYDRVKNANTLGALVEGKQATPSGGSPVGPASNLDVQLVAKSASSLTQTGGVPKFDEDLKKLRREAYQTRQRRIEFYTDRYSDLFAEDPKFKLTVRPIADRYISTKDLPQNKTPVIPTLTPEQVRANPNIKRWKRADNGQIMVRK